MRKFFSFVAGVMSGSIVGATVAILMAPAPGDELRGEARSRWEDAVAEAKKAMEETERQKELEFRYLKESGEVR